MSGGVGPCGDIRLPKEEEQEYKAAADEEAKLYHQSHPSSAASEPPKGGRFLSFRQLNALAVAVVFSASGLVALEDLGFVVFSFFYMHFLSRAAFPRRGAAPETPVFDLNGGLLRLYVFAGAVVGLFLPIAYILEGVFEGDKEGIKAAAPHVLLLSSQVFMEGVAFSDRFAVPVRVFVPVFYNSRRIFTIVEWLRTEIRKVDGEYGGSPLRLNVGRTLAMANMAFWSFNLFGFLLPVYLPLAFQKYYSAGYTKLH